MKEESYVESKRYERMYKMIASDISSEVTREDILELLEALKRNVRKTDDWQNWLNEDAWSDGKVYACLKVLESLTKLFPPRP